MFSDDELNEIVRCVEKEYYLNTKNSAISALLDRLRKIQISENFKLRYKNSLNVIFAYGYSPTDVNVAYSVHCLIPNLKENDFEHVCEYIKYVYLKLDDVNLDNITEIVKQLLDEGKDIFKFSAWDIADRLI